MDLNALQRLAVVALIAGPLVGFGAVHEPVLATVALVLVLAKASLPRVRHHGHTRALSWVLWTLPAHAAFQLLPLPPSFLKFLAPYNAAVWVASVGEGWHPLSIDPPATVFGLVTGLATALMFDVCAAILPKYRRFLAQAIAGSILLFAAVAVAHTLGESEALFGLVTPSTTDRWALLRTTLINPNHAGAAFAVMIPLGVALAVESGSMLWTGGAAVGLALTILTFSRGAIVVAIASVFALAWIAWSRSKLTARGWFIMIATLIAAVVTAVLLGKQRLAFEIAGLNLDKLQLAKAAYQMSSSSRWFGFGAGAFVSSFGPFEGNLGGAVRYTHAEHWPAQLLLDRGLVMGALVSVGLAASFVRSFRTMRDPVRRGAAIALVGLLIHDLGDFALTYAGVSGLAVALLAVAVVDTDPRILPTQPSALVARLALLPACGWVLLPSARSVEEDCARVLSDYRQGGLSQSSLEAAIRRHPAEPYFWMVAGMQRMPQSAAGPFLVRAVSLAPHRAQGHVWMARYFISRSRTGSAWPEYKTASRLSPPLRRLCWEEMARAGAPVNELSGSADTNNEAARALDLAGRSAEAEALDKELAKLAPFRVDAGLRRIARAKASSHLAEARLLANELVESAPDERRAYLAAADVAETNEGAEAVLVSGLQHVGNQADLLEALLRVRIRLKTLASSAPEWTAFQESLVGTNQTWRVEDLRAELATSKAAHSLALTFHLSALERGAPARSLVVFAEQAELRSDWRLAQAAWNALALHFPDEPAHATRAKSAAAKAGVW